MSFDESTAEAVIYDPLRRPAGVIRVFAWRAGQDVVKTLSDSEVTALGEERVQLFEESTYELELDNPAHRITSKLWRASTAHGRAHTGILRTGSRCGHLELSVVTCDGAVVGTCSVQVSSRKMDSRSDWREMLADVAQDSVDLVLDARSPVLNRLRADPRQTGLATYQRFAFLRGLVESRSFELAIRQVTLRPHSRQIREEVLTSVQRASRPTSNFSKHLARSSVRVEVPSSHPLSSRLRTIPREVPAFRLDETFDTEENRFVKFVLQEWAAFARAVAAKFTARTDRPLQLEAQALASRLDSLAASRMFSDVSRPNAIPHGSAILQRRSGYRELYQAWLRFEASAALTWDGLDDAYTAGTRDTALLYEHWVFLQVLRCLRSQPSSLWRLGDLYQIDTSGLHVRLKRGENLQVSGVLKWNGKRFRVTLDYNRLFSSGDPDGSWSASMQPDITITVHPRPTPDGGDKARVIRVHLDAKYRIQNADLAAFTESVDDSADTEDVVRHRRDDLLKMHAYRDGIPDSVGAFVLFPGSQLTVWHASPLTYLPAVGAVPLSPGSLGGLASLLARCLDEMCAAHSVAP